MPEVNATILSLAAFAVSHSGHKDSSYTGLRQAGPFLEKALHIWMCSMHDGNASVLFQAMMKLAGGACLDATLHRDSVHFTFPFAHIPASSLFAKG